MSIKLRDVAGWLAEELDGTGFLRSDKRGYAVVDTVRVVDSGTAVILHFGEENVRLTITRDNRGIS